MGSSRVGEIEAGSEQTIRARVTNVFYSAPDYTAGELTVDDLDIVIRFAGYAIVGKNDHIEAVGSWAMHPRFGDQFVIEDFTYLS